MLHELLNLDVNVAVVQETHFICMEDNNVLENYVILSAFSKCNSTRIFLQIGHSFKVEVILVFANDKSWLVVADVAVKSYKF